MVYFYELNVTSGAGTAAANAWLMVNSTLNLLSCMLMSANVGVGVLEVDASLCPPILQLGLLSAMPGELFMKARAAIYSRGTKGGIREETDAKAKMREGVKAFIEVKEEKWNKIRKWGLHR